MGFDAPLRQGGLAAKTAADKQPEHDSAACRGGGRSSGASDAAIHPAPDSSLSARLTLQIEVALDRDCTCSGRRSIQERRADRLGMTRAEIDAARERRGFDVQAAAAIDFACAVASQDQTRIFVAAVNAMNVGIASIQLAEIAALAMKRGDPQPPATDAGSRTN